MSYPDNYRPEENNRIYNNPKYPYYNSFQDAHNYENNNFQTKDGQHFQTGSDFDNRLNNAPNFAASPVKGGRQFGSELLGLILLTLITFFVSTLIFAIFIPIFSGAGSYSSDSSYQNGISNADNVQAVSAIVMMILGIILWFLPLFLLSWLLAKKGKTPGGLPFGYTSVRIEDGQVPGWAKAIGYNLVCFILMSFGGGLVLLLFLASPLFDSESGWHPGWLYKLFGLVAIDTRGINTVRQ